MVPCRGQEERKVPAEKHLDRDRSLLPRLAYTTVPTHLLAVVPCAAHLIQRWSARPETHEPPDARQRGDAAAPARAGEIRLRARLLLPRRQAAAREQLLLRRVLLRVKLPAEAVPYFQGAYGGSGEIHVPPLPPPEPGLLRRSSSTAGHLSRLTTNPHGTGNGSIAGTRPVMASYYQGAVGNHDALAQQQRRLSSQWSFSSKDMMPNIPEIGESMATGDTGTCSSDLSRSFSMSSWDDTNSVMFNSPSKKVRLEADGDGGMVTSFSNIDSQFALSTSSLEVPGIDDYIVCRVRAKRGCATHPRSIAERERRIRISKNLRKLQELVPTMDKQTNTSDMLDIALDYIKVVQDKIEKLKLDQGNCSCSAKKEC